jgi:hypothetical protein
MKYIVFFCFVFANCNYLDQFKNRTFYTTKTYKDVCDEFKENCEMHKENQEQFLLVEVINHMRQRFQNTFVSSSDIGVFISFFQKLDHILEAFNSSNEEVGMVLKKIVDEEIFIEQFLSLHLVHADSQDYWKMLLHRKVIEKFPLLFEVFNKNFVFVFPEQDCKKSEVLSPLHLEKW